MPTATVPLPLWEGFKALRVLGLQANTQVRPYDVSANNVGSLYYSYPSFAFGEIHLPRGEGFKRIYHLSELSTIPL